MKVIVIGSKGFIGSHTLSYFNQLYKEGAYGCDVYPYYGEKRYFQIDVSNSDFASIFKNNSFDLCINCSGAASVPDSYTYPLKDYSLNTVNVFKLLNSLREYNPTCKFINLSSAAVYGNPISLPIKESDPCIPVSPYGYHKWQSELICQEYSKFYNLKTCSIRIFSAYGPGLKKQLFWDLYQKSLTNAGIQLWGTGNESRDFIYIKDLVKALYLVSEHAKMNGESINLANGEEIFIKDAAKTFYSLLKYNHPVEFMGNERKGDPINWVSEVNYLKSLGYIPEYNLEAGLSEYVQWLKELK